MGHRGRAHLYRARHGHGHVVQTASSQEAAMNACPICELVTRCDGAEGMRADGSNIQTMAAHAILERLEQENAA